MNMRLASSLSDTSVRDDVLAPVEGVSLETLELIESGVSPNTLRAYKGALARLDAWRGGRAITDAVMAEYITHLHKGGLAPASISVAVGAVQRVSKLQGVTVLGPKTEMALLGARKDGAHRGRGQVDALDWEAVEVVCEKAEHEGTLQGLRDSALIRLMSDGLLRISEACDVDVEHIHGDALFIPVSKTDPLAKGTHLYIGDATLHAIDSYTMNAAIYEGALFRRVRWYNHIGEGRLTPDGARKAIVKRAKAAGIDGFISGHSLRVGAAVSLARAGASVVEMQVAGRWDSEAMPKHYASAELASRGAVAKYKYGK